jgi:hypothetical protein
MADIKKILVVARDDAEEAMRVAAGLTIFGHEVRFLFAGQFEVTPRFEENAELLELADVDEIATLVPFAECDEVSAEEAAMFLVQADAALVL